MKQTTPNPDSRPIYEIRVKIPTGVWIKKPACRCAHKLMTEKMGFKASDFKHHHRCPRSDVRLLTIGKELV